jgi:hypothetical protein
MLARPGAFAIRSLRAVKQIDNFGRNDRGSLSI